MPSFMGETSSIREPRRTIRRTCRWRKTANYSVLKTGRAQRATRQAQRSAPQTTPAEPASPVRWVAPLGGRSEATGGLTSPSHHVEEVQVVLRRLHLVEN